MARMLIMDDVNLTTQSRMVWVDPPPEIFNLMMTLLINRMRESNDSQQGNLVKLLKLFNTDQWIRDTEHPIDKFPASVVTVKGSIITVDSGESILDDGDYEKISDFHFIPDLMDLTNKVLKSDEPRSGVYMIQIGDFKGVYVGSSENLHKRLGEHRNDLKNRRHCNKHLQNAFVEVVEDPSIPVKVYVIETSCGATPFWLEDTILNHIRLSARVFNIGETASNPRLKVKVSEETRKKQSVAHSGKLASALTKARMSASRKGRKNSPEHVISSAMGKSKKLMGDGIEYPSASEASKITGIGQSSITRRLANPNYPTWYMIGSSKDPEVISGNKEITVEIAKDNIGYLVDGVTYNTSAEVGKVHGVSSATVKRRAVDPRFSTWSQVELTDTSKLIRSTSKSIVVDGVPYPSLRIAADALGLHYSSISAKLAHPSNHPNSYYVGSEKDPTVK